MMGGAKGIEPFVKKFQQGMLRVKYANVPVVVGGVGHRAGRRLRAGAAFARSASRISKAISAWWKSASAWCRRAAA